ncbi:5'/3'-nucleotidase SurE [Halopseudomonas maritima]|uniref:5'/3'-nucleotidase SurE n=1 Tax=Halopseudomonas maritima TaxID=2918528 RepID=UPI001EE9C475|nr:5'/3'-nucleotidase SurE [Halopseudomonas maritima]UJJ31559.1 5'/3'-nucleotidase SurE [Halopseudomonas maritima]
MLPIRLLTAAVSGCLASPAFALNILLTNDDGLTPNLQALQSALVSAGHSVVVSVPCTNQSGKGMSLTYLRPLTTLQSDCRNGAARAGDPAVGSIASMDNAYYVDGTPAMATLHGLDVLAPRYWGALPDLVLSGPNEGANVGPLVSMSGTVSNSQIALFRGVPAVAISAHMSTEKQPELAPEVAGLTMTFLAQLKADPQSGALLPPGVGININYPEFALGESAALEWGYSVYGSYDPAPIMFVADLSQDPLGARYGMPAYPGITADVRRDTSFPEAQQDDMGVLTSTGRIAVTAMQLGYEATPPVRQWLRLNFRELLGE